MNRLNYTIMHTTASDIKSFLQGKIISGIKLADDLKELDNEDDDSTFIESITISFQDTGYRLKILAVGDCCSTSWFEKSTEDFSNVIGKELTKLVGEFDEINSTAEDKIYPLTMEFTDGSVFEFIMKNSSNGYYSGWFEMAIIDEFQLSEWFNKKTISEVYFWNSNTISILFKATRSMLKICAGDQNTFNFADISQFKLVGKKLIGIDEKKIANSINKEITMTFDQEPAVTFTLMNLSENPKENLLEISTV
jgi:hypothetical protein